MIPFQKRNDVRSDFSLGEELPAGAGMQAGSAQAVQSCGGQAGWMRRSGRGQDWCGAAGEQGEE